MPLVDMGLAIDEGGLPGDVLTFLREADRRIERFQVECRIPAFVPSDFVKAYGTLRALAAADVTPGNLFCEWGSGFGVVACLASMLDFDARGIEIEGELVECARQLAEDFGLPVEFIHGSFIPRRSDACFSDGGFSWLTTESDSTEEELGLGPADFDVIFAYPWPDEERVTEALFERHANHGAVLVTYRGEETLRLQRKRKNRVSRR